MGRTLKVHLTNASPDLVHGFRNFGEEVWSALRADYAVSIEEIDASTNEFHLREIPRREVRTVAARVRKLVQRYPGLVIKCRRDQGRRWLTLHALDAAMTHLLHIDDLWRRASDAGR